MRTRNEYIKVRNGRNEVIMRDVFTDKYLSLFSKSQYETDMTKLYNYNHNKMMPRCFIKFDEPLDFISGRNLKYKLNNEVAASQELITTNHTILSENNEINFINFDDDFISYKIFGKCEQKTTVPKNLYNYQDVKQKSDMITVWEDDWIYVEYDNTQGTEKYANFWTNNLKLKENTNYNIICEIEVFKNEYTGTSDNSLVIAGRHANSNGGQFQKGFAYPIDTLGSVTTKQMINTTMKDLSTVVNGLRTFVTIRAGSKVSLKFRISVLEDLSITAETFSYEPFMNKIPSLDFPSEIKTLKDELIIETSNQSIIIDLHDNELNSVNDVYDEFNVTTGELIKKIGKINSYNNEEITTNFLSTTGELDKGATVYYELQEPVKINLIPMNLPFLKNEISKDDFDISIGGIANSNGDKQNVITTYFYSTKNNIYNIKDNITENDLNKYANRKITAFGFGRNDIMAYFDATNYSISIIKDCEFCISRRDIFSSDAICQGYDYPLHLAIMTPRITYDDNQYYSTVHARLYSVGLGKTIGDIEEEKIIGEDIDVKVVDDTSFSLVLRKGNQQSIHSRTNLFCGNRRYPLPYFADIELYPSTNLFCGNNKYPLASNYKYIIYKYRLYYIDRDEQLIDLDQFYTMSLKNDAKGLFEILTKIERS